jgi:hypothetical protein
MLHDLRLAEQLVLTGYNDSFISWAQFATPPYGQPVVRQFVSTVQFAMR